MHAGRVLVEAWPPGRCGDDVEQAISAAFAVGARRTALQDLRFLVDEIVEIAARALSPGVNDPFTAVTCLDWLGAALSELAHRELPSNLRLDDKGELRLIAHPVTFERFMDRSFGALAQYCAADSVATLRLLRALGEISLSCGDYERTALLALHASRMEELANTSLYGFNRERVASRAAQLRRILAEPDYRRKMRDTGEWLGGTA